MPTTTAQEPEPIPADLAAMLRAAALRRKNATQQHPVKPPRFGDKARGEVGGKARGKAGGKAGGHPCSHPTRGPRRGRVRPPNRGLRELRRNQGRDQGRGFQPP